MITENDFKKRIEALNQPEIHLDQNDELKIGWKKIADFISQIILSTVQNKRNRTCIIGFDGYVGTDWESALEQLKKKFTRKEFDTTFINVENCFKSAKEINELLEPYLGDDPVFGRLYKQGLKSLFDLKKLSSLKTQLRSLKKDNDHRRLQLVICYGTGASINMLRSYYDFIFYADLTREEALKRNKSWSQLSGKTQSISPKKLYYVDFQINDKHRNGLLNRFDFYIDGNRVDNPILISKSLLYKTAAALALLPFRLKPMYEPGPWGGQWLKKIRNLPANWINCAWSFEVIAQEMSLLVTIDQTYIELPWTTFFHLQYDQIMGDVPKRIFGGEFPIRYDYLDTMNGGDLSIQVHPTTPYIHKHFGEPYHQGEMYYIVAARNGATVNLGLNEQTRPEEFYEAARLADEQGIKFNYRDYVNSVPSKIHDLLLIPAGTVHGSGEGLVVLEISATTYRYTFKIYDHLRPDLNGVMRPIHVNHAFNVIKWFRRKNWVAKNLKQEPVLIRSGHGWAEYLIGDRREFFHVVFRLEFDREIDDNTNGKFHVLTLVAGDSVLLHSKENTAKKLQFKFSETIIVPACFGKYRIINQGLDSCKIAKARLR